MNLLKAHHYARKLATDQESLDRHKRLLPQDTLSLGQYEYREEILPIIHDLRRDITLFSLLGAQIFVDGLDLADWTSLTAFHYDRIGSANTRADEPLISSKSLYYWPALPNTVRRLIIADASFGSIGKLPDDLEQLAVIRCPNVLDCPEDLPDTVFSLYIPGTKITKLPKKLPTSLNSLAIPESLMELPDTWNDNNIWSIEVGDAPVEDLATLPRRMHYLELGDRDIIAGIKAFPERLDYIRCGSNNPIVQRLSGYEWGVAVNGLIGKQKR